MASASSIRAHYDIKGAVEHLYDVTIFGKTVLTTVTKHPQAVTEWINGVNSDAFIHRHIGFEVELINGPDGVPDIIGTVQFCVGDRCLVIQILRMSDYPPCLDPFLSDPTRTFFGVDVESKLDMLTDQCLSFVEGPVAYRDLRDVAAQFYRRPELRNATQSELVVTAFNIGIDKPTVVETDWGRRGKLSDAQVEYACVEAFASFELARRLHTVNN